MPRPIRPDEEHTYDEWQSIGYQVQRGSTHVSRDGSGRALFSAAQVAPRNSIPPHRQGYQPASRRPRRSRGETEAVSTPSTPPSTTARSIYDWASTATQYFPASSLSYPSFTIDEATIQRVAQDAQTIEHRALDRLQQERARSVGAQVRQGYGFRYIADDEAVLEPMQAPIRQRSVLDYAPQDELTGFQKLVMLERERKKER